MVLNEGSICGAVEHRNKGRSGAARGSRFVFALLIFLPVLASLVFFVSRSFRATGQDVSLSGPSEGGIDDIVAIRNDMESTMNFDSIGHSSFSASGNLVGGEAYIHATAKPSQMAAVLGKQTRESEDDKSVGGNIKDFNVSDALSGSPFSYYAFFILHVALHNSPIRRSVDRSSTKEEQHEKRSTELGKQEDDVTLKLDNAYMGHSELLDLGKYSTWKKESENKNLDSTIRVMRDQIIMARLYLNMSKKKNKLDLYRELQIRIKKSRRALGEANVDSELHYSAPEKIKTMAQTLSKARDQLFECELVTRKLRAMLLTEEEKVRTLKRQNTFLTQLGVKGITGGLRCLSLRLTIDYYLLPPEKRVFPRRENLEHPYLYHYALFSDNVLAAAVVANSTVVNAKDSSKHVFHIVTDNLNFGAMKMWFLLNPPKEATVHVENLDEFEWLNSSYCPVLRQLKSAAMKEYYFKAALSTTHSSGVSNQKYRNPKYLSMLNHLRFYLPQIYPKLDKILFLDDDTVVQKDLTALWRVDLKGKVNGAVETCVQSFHRFNKYLNFSNPHIARKFDPNACGWAYGMNIFDLMEWKKNNITAIYHQWQNLNQDRLLWKLGTLPPGLMTFNGLTYPIDKSWHVLGLGYNPSVDQTEIENAAVIHYNGNMKPWLEMAITKYRPHWIKYIDYDHPYLRGCHFIR